MDFFEARNCEAQRTFANQLMVCALQVLFVLIEEDVLWTTPWDPYWAGAPGVADPGLPLHS